MSKVLAMESFTEENYVGLKEYVMDLKVPALAFHLAQFSKAAKAVGGGSELSFFEGGLTAEFVRAGSQLTAEGLADSRVRPPAPQ